ncbi:hypothetical protein AOL_s00097g159 [Orbilia oligospora ATCC 24927]|uniref:RNA polymerase II assembly factor Rtp1 C-terminal domain-containing protein n=2 Tax=Orbilia oligospora TaxID=2813651 RepID=G1XII2_ARTOA|nr:hypothetical protein AOL_s00097g159 [Orbilia oligospora ATCC 24927]EGX47113.1 hypothetical protein AOL_s00097g159 [Orbilia oligospora ATCC 24927]KAF3278029.1 hypothetical protein TWF970_004906 [Orbilia oligospora]
MSSQKTFQATLNTAATFLQPVFKPQNASNRHHPSIIESLYQTLPKNDISASSSSVEAPSYNLKSSKVILYALSLLSKLNQSATPKNSSPDALFAPRDQRIILGLADLILLEGIYPNTTSGILPPLDRRTKSSGYFSQIQAAAAAASISQHEDGTDSRNVELLAMIVDNIQPILVTASNEVSDAVRERLQMDLVACLGELAFNPENGTEEWRKKFYSALDNIQTPILLPLLVPLILPTTPPWFQKPLTTYLSSIPLARPGGVKDEITFFIDPTNEIPTQRVALQQASKLIGSVPTASTPDQYFSVVAPQLIELLDEVGNLGLAAGIVINDVFERRKKGVEKYFFPRLLRPLRPAKSQIPVAEEVENGDIITLTEEEDLERAINRISSLFQSSNGKSYLASRILDTLTLPLWGLWQFAVAIKATSPTVKKTPQDLLIAYMKLKPSSTVLDEIVQNFGYDGDDHWIFTRGEMGQVKIVARDTDLPSKAIEVKDIEERTPSFISLALAANDDVFTDFFLSLCRRWLGGGFTISAEGGDRAAFGLLFQLKVLEGILEHHSERLTRRPEQVIILVKEILDSHVRTLEKERERLEALQNPSMNTLGKIMDGEEDFDSLVADDNDETSSGGDAIGIALQLLNSIVSTSFSRTVSEQEKKLLSTLQPSLKYLSSERGVGGSIASLTRSLGLFISTQDIPLTGPIDGDVKPVDEKVLKQQQTLQTALLYLQDQMVPIRAHGLEILKGLIKERSSVVDVQTITKLLIDMLQDKESFVYLGVVKTLCELADKHPGTVIGMLVGVYVDEEEKMGIDERLKVGEALMGTVQRLGQTAVGKVAEEVGNVMVGLAGRRKRRYKEAGEATREKEEAERRIKKEGEMDEEYRKVLNEARVEAGIDVEGGKKVKIEEVEDDEQWISKVGEEDYRVRTSALSVLGILFETNASGVPVGVTLAAVEVALRILELERGKEQATVRRAAVHLVSSVLNGLEKNGTVELLKVIPRERLEDIVRVLGYTRATDDDGLVREQAGVLVEALTE